MNAGCGDRLVPNWSFADAVNCTVWPGETVALGGATAMVVSVGLTDTVVLLVAVRSCASLAVT